MKRSSVVLGLFVLFIMAGSIAAAPVTIPRMAALPHYTTWDSKTFDFMGQAADGSPIADGPHQLVFSLHTDLTLSSPESDRHF